MNERNAATRLREEFDADATRGSQRASKIPTDAAAHEVICSECAEHWFVDDEFFRQIKNALDLDPANNLFVCDECVEESEEISHLR